jgi:hypothetical protein
MIKENLCIVKYINGKQFIFLPDGTMIPGQIGSVVKDFQNEFPTATIEIHVNLDNVEVLPKK